MSEDLADLKRLKVTQRGRAWLTAKSISTGSSAQDIVRELIDQAAEKEIHGAKILLALVDGEGHVRDGRVHLRDEQGRSGK